jgi:nucleoid-associated protein YgaU
MQQYYQGDYWDQGLEQRVRAARDRLDAARTRLDEARARLTELPATTTYVVGKSETVSPASSYKYADPRMRAMAGPEPPARVDVVELVVRNDAERKLCWQRYLLDFQYYITVKLEYERLEAELSQARMLAPENHPPSDGTRGRRGPVGSSTGSPAAEPDPLDKYREEARRRLKEATDKLKRERSDRAVQETLTESANAQLVGLDDAPETQEAWQTVGDVVEEQRDQAKQNFKQRCTTDNYREWLNRQGNGQLVGREEPDRDPLAGVKRLRPPGQYTIQPGDTLSKLAKEFYGQEWLWHVIYEANWGATPDNPNLILPGLTLNIP